jgi:hypothetical protein
MYTPPHGSVARYNGCRCDKCVSANERNGGGKSARPLGPVEKGVLAQLKELPEEKRQPGLVALARRLARDLDLPALGTSHAALGRQLQATLVALGETKQAAKSKLASITAMADRKRA